MKIIGVIGNGGHFKKNIQNVLEKDFELHIYEYDKCIKENERKIKLFLENDFEFVYISTPLKYHYYYALESLKNSNNVIIEKPGVNNIDELKELYKIAKEKKLFVKIVDMHTKHPIYNDVKKELKNKPYRVELNFCVPKQDNIYLYNETEFGGAVFETGYYPLSVIDDVYGLEKINDLKIYNNKNNNVIIRNTSMFSIDNSLFIINFGIDNFYQNEIILYFEDKKIHYKFAFSKPIKPSKIITNLIGQEESSVFDGDQFDNFFRDIKQEKSKIKLTELMIKINEF